MLSRHRQPSYTLSSLFRSRPTTIPGPRAAYPLHFAVRLARDKLALFADMAAHGDVSQIRIGPQDVALLMNPEDIRRVLVTEQRNFCKGHAISRAELLLGQGLLTSEGELHLRQRRLMQPAFHRERIQHYADVMTVASRRASDSWAGGDVDIQEAMMRLTLGIAGRTLFGVDIEKDAKDIAKALELSLRMFNYSILPLGNLFERAPIPWVMLMHRSIRRMDEVIYRIIETRQQQGNPDHGDLLSMMLAAHDGGSDTMTDEQLRDETVTLLLAGHETTAIWLTWTWYLLSQHADVEARLHEELDRVLRGAPATLADVPRLEYTRRVLAESMRMYSPAWALERRALNDFEAGGHRIRAGALVIMSQWLVHRDARWWDEPHSFNPDRWALELDTARRKFSYFPFGAGTRVCIGEHFAWQEAIIALATLAQHWTMEYLGDAPPIPDPQVTLRPRGGLRMRLRRRVPLA